MDLGLNLYDNELFIIESILIPDDCSDSEFNKEVKASWDFESAVFCVKELSLDSFMDYMESFSVALVSKILTRTLNYTFLFLSFTF